MPTIKALVIPADDERDMYVVDLEQESSYQMREIIGGWFAASEGREVPITLWYHDEGKILDLPMNNRATCVWWSADRRFLRFDYMAGDVIITGLADDDGETQGCPDDFLGLVSKTEGCSFSIHAHHQVVVSTFRGSYMDALTNAVILAQNSAIVDGIKVFAA